MHTEDEARTKWCPHARIGSDSTGLGCLNRDFAKGPPDAALCIASECMAWRFEPVEAWEARYEQWEDAADIGGVNRGPEPKPLGYCGLSGGGDG